MKAGPLTSQAMAAVVTDVTINFTVHMVTIVTMVMNVQLQWLRERA
jgi:hypothetical protein